MYADTARALLGERSNFLYQLEDITSKGWPRPPLAGLGILFCAFNRALYPRKYLFRKRPCLGVRTQFFSYKLNNIRAFAFRVQIYQRVIFEMEGEPNLKARIADS